MKIQEIILCLFDVAIVQVLNHVSGIITLFIVTACLPTFNSHAKS